MSDKRQPDNKARTTFNISGSTNAGIVNTGGEMNVHDGVNVDMGSTYTFSGNFTGAMVNVKSQLRNVTQSIAALPSADQATKDELTQLTAQLADLLATTPNERAMDAEKVSKRVETLVDEANKPDPDRELFEFNLESLKKAIAMLSTVVPLVVPVADKIITLIRSLVP